MLKTLTATPLNEKYDAHECANCSSWVYLHLLRFIPPFVFILTAPVYFYVIWWAAEISSATEEMRQFNHSRGHYEPSTIAGFFFVAPLGFGSVFAIVFASIVALSSTKSEADLGRKP